MNNNDPMTSVTANAQHFKYFHILAIIYIAGLMTSLTVSARLFPFHIPMTHLTILLTGGTWTIPLSFFIVDITTEVYGYTKSRQLVQTSIFVLSIYILYTKCLTFLPIPSVYNIDDSYNSVFNALPKHLFALLVALFVGSIVNNYLISKLKIKFSGNYLALRFIASATVGEAALQLIGTSIAWFGHLRFTTDILPFIIFSLVYKILFETIMTPINISLCKKLKKAEGVDVYDDNINFNPFSFKLNKN